MKPGRRAFRRCFSRCAAVGAALFIVWALAPVTAQAHRVTVFAWVEGNTVHTESKFSGGRYAKDARIEVYDAAGEMLLEGRTDEAGRFSFPSPRPEDLRVVLIAGTGHRNEWRVSAAEFAGAELAAPAVAAPSPKTPHQDGRGAATVDTAATVTLSPGELQVLIEAALDKKLAPVLHRLAQLEGGPTLPDIIGGIGYILGLVGLAAYLQSRRKSG